MANVKLTTTLDTGFIQSLMDEKGLNDKEMAQVFAGLGKTITAKEERAASKKWGRFMKSGKTRPEGAVRIAGKFELLVSDLQQPDSEVSLKRIVELMKHAVEKMKAANDVDGLTRIAKELCFYQSDSLREWDTVQDEEYASLADKIEWLHLSGEPGELELYAKLFGVTAQELRPAPLASFWLFSSSNRFCPSLGKLVSGHAGVLAEIEKNWKALPDMFRNRSETIKAIVSKEGARYRLRFESSNLSSLAFSCLFYACDTKKNTGLPSRNASKWELERLMSYLKYFLFDHADTVIIDGEQFPPENSNGVFQVRSFNVVDGNDQHEIGTRIIDADYLFRGSLQKLLRTHDAGKWRFTNPEMLSPSWIFPGVELSLVENEFVIKIYQITTGWQDSDGDFHEEHWPLISRKQFIESFLGARDGLIITDENGEIPPFEPEPEIEPFPPKCTSEAFQVRFFDERNNDGIPSRKVNFENRFLLHFSLQTFLEKHGNAKWRFDPPKSHVFRGIRMQLPENKYCRINLGWLDTQGEFHDGTWSVTSREEFIKRAQDLQNKFMYVPNEHEVIPSFEPEPQASAIKGVAA